MVKPFEYASRLFPPRLLVRAGVRAGLVLTDPLRLLNPAALQSIRLRGLGVIVRAYSDAAEAENAAWQAFCRQRGIPLLVAGKIKGSDRQKVHHLREPQIWGRPQSGARTGAAHTRRALHAARKHRLEAILVSPVFPTRSHVGAKTLGPHRFARLIRGSGCPVFALGGVTTKTARRLKGIPGLQGIAAIDGWTESGS